MPPPGGWLQNCSCFSLACRRHPRVSENRWLPLSSKCVYVIAGTIRLGASSTSCFVLRAPIRCDSEGRLDVVLCVFHANSS